MELGGLLVRKSRMGLAVDLLGNSGGSVTGAAGFRTIKDARRR